MDLGSTVFRRVFTVNATMRAEKHGFRHPLRIPRCRGARNHPSATGTSGQPGRLLLDHQGNAAHPSQGAGRCPHQPDLPGRPRPLPQATGTGEGQGHRPVPGVGPAQPVPGAPAGHPQEHRSRCFRGDVPNSTRQEPEDGTDSPPQKMHRLIAKPRKRLHNLPPLL
jgi:hypothetical protein